MSGDQEYASAFGGGVPSIRQKQDAQQRLQAGREKLAVLYAAQALERHAKRDVTSAETGLLLAMGWRCSPSNSDEWTNPGLDDWHPEGVTREHALKLTEQALLMVMQEFHGADPDRDYDDQGLLKEKAQ